MLAVSLLPLLLVTCLAEELDPLDHSTYRPVMNLGPPCPLEWNSAPCQCTGHSKAPNIDCSFADMPDQIQWVFSGLPGGLSFLTFTLHQSNLTSLPASNPFATSNFTVFTITETNITFVPDDFFKTSENTVQTISITKTDITEFPYKAISGYPKLQVLILEHNKLTTIPADMFGEKGLPALHDLKLRGNQIKTIAGYAFSNMPYLYRLDVSQNNLTHLDANTFSMKNHKETVLLTISKNSISDIHKDAFEGLSFSSISLEFNHLQTLKQSVFESMLAYLDRTDSSIYLMGNPFTCNKTLEWLVEKSAPMKQHLRDFVCPNGKTLETLTIEDLSHQHFPSSTSKL